MSKQRIIFLISIIINVTIITLEIYCLIIFINVLSVEGTDRFRYYTNLSNIFLGVTSIITIPYLIKSFIKNEDVTPTWLSILQLTSVSGTTLTALVVVALLAPLTSYQAMYEGVRLITHAITPALAFFFYVFLSNRTIYRWPFSFIGCTTFVCYGILYFYMVVIFSKWPDIYSVNVNGLWWLTCPSLLLTGVGVTQLIYFLRKLLNKHKIFY